MSEITKSILLDEFVKMRELLLGFAIKKHPELFDKWLGPTVSSPFEIIGLLEDILKKES